MTTARGFKSVFGVLMLVAGVVQAADPFPLDAEAVKRLCPITQVADFRAVSVKGSRAEVCAALWVAVIKERPWADSASYRTAVEDFEKGRK